MNSRGERNSKRTRDRRRDFTNRDRGRYDDENNHKTCKQERKKSTGTRLIKDIARPRSQRTECAQASELDRHARKWKMDEFDEKQAKYSIENMSPTELDRLTDLNSDDFDPISTLYTNKKLTCGKTHDCVAQLLRKWDIEDGTIVQKQSDEPRKVGLWKNEQRRLDNQNRNTKKFIDWADFRNGLKINGNQRKLKQFQKRIHWPDRIDDELESIDDLVMRVSAQNRPLSTSSRRKSIPPKRRIIPPYSSQSSDHSKSPQASRLDHFELRIPKSDVKTETKSKSPFKLHQPKAFRKNTMLENKISELQSGIIYPELMNKSDKETSENKNDKKPAEDVKVSEYLQNLEKNTTYNNPDKSMKPLKKRSDKSNTTTGKLKLGSPQKIEKMKKLRRSPRKSYAFTQTFGLSVMSNTKLPGRIPKKKKN